MNLASHIDHTVLKPTTTLPDIERICTEAINYHFAAVCVPPYFAKDAASLLAGTTVKVATVIGFPFGYSHFSAKLAEVQQAVKDKAAEVDVVMNIAAFKKMDFLYLQTEIEGILKITQDNKIVLKVIIESGILTNEEIIDCCSFYKKHPIDFLKTSTGYAEGGASIEAVQIMKQHLPSSIKIKASGGIKTYAFAKELVEAGAERLGCSASVAIVNGEPSSTGDY